MLDSILISELPKTFANAVFVTRQMGVGFLWIDSLCIMQDSLSDWEQEASIMSDVYRGSLCNIAATGSSHANEGCLYERPYPVQPCAITTAWEDMPSLMTAFYSCQQGLTQDSSIDGVFLSYMIGVKYMTFTIMNLMNGFNTRSLIEKGSTQFQSFDGRSFRATVLEAKANLGVCCDE